MRDISQILDSMRTLTGPDVAADDAPFVRNEYHRLVEELEIVLEHWGADNPSQARMAFCRLHHLPRYPEPKYCAVTKCTRSVPRSMFTRGCSYCPAHVPFASEREQLLWGYISGGGES